VRGPHQVGTPVHAVEASVTICSKRHYKGMASGGMSCHAFLNCRNMWLLNGTEFDRLQGHLPAY